MAGAWGESGQRPSLARFDVALDECPLRKSRDFPRFLGTKPVRHPRVVSQVIRCKLPHGSEFTSNRVEIAQHQNWRVGLVSFRIGERVRNSFVKRSK
jgi:hypothetical protein